MKLMRVEVVNYKVLYILEGGNYMAFRIIDGRWQKWGSDWKEVKDGELIKKLETLLEDSGK